jgi:hypothetical protein
MHVLGHAKQVCSAVSAACLIWRPVFVYDAVAVRFLSPLFWIPLDLGFVVVVASGRVGWGTGVAGGWCHSAA